MNKVKSFLRSKQGKATTFLTMVGASLPVFASDPINIATVIQTSMQQIVTDTLLTIAAVAPIGITIFGATFAWKYGVKFFKSVAGN